MLFNDLTTAFLAVGLLLVLSIITISLCRRDVRKFTSYAEFLFSGKLFQHSVASNIGAIFSVTYFFGATFIYATIYNQWTIVMAGICLLLASFVVISIVRTISADLPSLHDDQASKNGLLSWLELKLSKGNFRRLMRLYQGAYILLLVEELAISRVILTSIFPNQPLVSALVLTLIIIVMISYLYFGGFRAVLNSDLTQGAIVTVFVIILIFYTYSLGHIENIFVEPITIKIIPLSLGLIGWVIYGFAWIVCGVDFYSRLNIRSNVKNKSAYKIRKNLTVVSLLGTFLVISVGILFAYSVSSELGTFTSPVEYFQSAVSFFMHADHVVIRAIFLVSIFCMIFTTIDTLILTFMQVSWHAKSKRVTRKNVLTIIILALVVSALMPSNSVCAVGILIGSIMIPIMFVLMPIIFPNYLKWLPSNNTYAFVAGGISVVPFILNYNLLESHFEWQFTIPLGVFVITLVCGLVAKFIEKPHQKTNTL